MRRLESSQILPTANNLGWSSNALSEVSLEFIAFIQGKGKHALDVGAGFGVATLPALEGGATVTANDLSSEHLEELKQQVPLKLRENLRVVQGHFPNELDFPAACFDAIHMSQVLHFLRPDEVTKGLTTAYRWLRSGGKLFILAATPYQATHATFIPEFANRKAKGEAWPGVIQNIRSYNTHWSVELNPGWLHVFDEDTLSDALRKAGFHVEWARMFSRRGLPAFCRLDGRENLGCVAVK